jgi:hypothetical protein
MSFGSQVFQNSPQKVSGYSQTENDNIFESHRATKRLHPFNLIVEASSVAKRNAVEIIRDSDKKWSQIERSSYFKERHSSMDERVM